MDFLIDTVYYVVPFLVLLGILVFVHEFGHFIVARWCGVQVTAFSIGFGKTLWSRKDKKNTVWKLSLIPLGGYCQFLGDDDASSSTTSDQVTKLTEEEKKHAFFMQNPFKKLAIVLAGPGANYLFAIMVFTSIFFFLGKVVFPPVVGDVMKGSAAEEAGIQIDDKIVKINGHDIKNFSDISREVALNVDPHIVVDVLRGGESVTFSFPLKVLEYETSEGKTEKKMMLGVQSRNQVEIEYSNLSFVAALKDATIETWDVTAATLRGLGQIFSGKRSGEEIGGILRIAEMSGDVSKTGVISFFVFMALISINLGLINLFPIPVLDGGHVVIYLIEIVTGREVNEKVKEVLFKIGLTLIILLMVFATWNDVYRLFNRWFS
ncbi:MAG: RIP metalloprotease RseP [Alphaproteobacteria bacterium]|nr:RIP metalloprotease RseP [Alphaproteobacteria bacterium]